ncbi:HEAT repeat domain-containing protein [uncultured Pseudodesulfovibrio sp.]|uniref:HEAT repeat domain-containing protein n=1 Tax=uncultured Pseudodesulfovibrio sp. TaxID=2035858 RepID=UPI0029C9402E|nr:HEAT repeat domain-containing protein [uncultured Pseudodesulfovibrio sp.]
MDTIKRHFPAVCRTAAVILCLLTAAPAWCADASGQKLLNDDILALAGKLGCKDKATRTAALARLRQKGQSAMSGLMNIPDDAPVSRRRGAIIGMASLPLAELGTNRYISALADEDTAVRSLAAHALAIVGPSAAPETAAQLGSSDPKVRGAAAYALKLMGKHSVPALVGILSSEDMYARSKAAWLLGRMGHEALPAVPALIAALEGGDARVMHVVAEAVDLIGADPGLVFQHLILIGVRPGCPKARIGSQATPTLVRLLSRPGTPLGQTAFHALAAIGPPAKAALLEAVKTGSPSQRTASALLLVDMDPDMALILPDDLRSSLAGAKRQP